MSGQAEKPPSAAARAVDLVEKIAAVMLGLVTILIFLSAIGRYLFARPVPDAFDLSRLTLAVAVMWGFASVAFRGSHIKVDLLALAMPPRVRKWLDLAAWLTLLVFTAGMTWKIGGRLFSQWPRGELTMDLRLPHWPFLAAILVGLMMAMAMTIGRLWLVLRHDEGLEAHETYDDGAEKEARHG